MKENRRTIRQKSGLGTAMTIIQDCEETLRSLFVSQSVLVLVEKGTKTFIEKGREFVAESGEMAVLCGNTSIDVINTSEKGDIYLARVIAFDEAVLKEYEKNRKNEGDDIVYVAKEMSSEFRKCFDACWQLFEESEEDVPQSVSRHRMAELLLWLADIGCFSLMKYSDTVSDKIRRVIEKDITKKWNSVEISRELGMSESTIRRKLLPSGQTIAGIIQDVRMVSAMGILQSTDMSVTEVSLAVGYESPSRFAGRFKVRFGFPPSRIRGHRR